MYQFCRNLLLIIIGLNFYSVLSLGQNATQTEIIYLPALFLITLMAAVVMFYIDLVEDDSHDIDA